MTDFETLLDQCVTRLQTGESLDRILMDHPDHATRLRALLEVVARVSTLPAPRARPTAYTAARQRMVAALDARKNSPRPTRWQRLFAIPRLDFSFLRELPANMMNLALIALLIISLVWLFSSLDLDPEPAAEQTPTPTSVVSPTPPETPVPTGTASLIPPATQTLTVSTTLRGADALSSTVTLTPSATSTPIFITRTPTPTPTRDKEEEEPTLTPLPTATETETPTSTPAPTSTSEPPYPPPETATPTPTLTPTEPNPTPTETPVLSDEPPTLTPTPF